MSFWQVAGDVFQATNGLWHGSELRPFQGGGLHPRPLDAERELIRDFGTEFAIYNPKIAITKIRAITQRGSDIVRVYCHFVCGILALQSLSCLMVSVIASRRTCSALAEFEAEIEK
jgi:hypothetical protein